jgi:hypothetical protein
MKQFVQTLKVKPAVVAVLLALLSPVSLMAAPVVISINDVPNAAPVIQVKGAPNGYALYTGPGVVDPTVEDGAAVVLYGVDLEGLVPDWAGRFTVPNAPLWYRSAVDIVWIQHDPGIFQAGALVVAFDSALPGVYYYSPGLVDPTTGMPINTDEDLGPVTNNWVTVYSSDLLVIRYKPHSYRM